MHVLRKFSALLVSISANSGCSMAGIFIVTVDEQPSIFKAAEQVTVLLLLILILYALGQCPLFRDV